MKKLIFKIITNVIILMVVGIALSFVFDNAIIDNYIALGQMNNSDEAYLFMQYFNKAKNAAFTTYGIIAVIVLGKSIYNICEFLIKTKIKKGENK
ncbi:MAG: hypothetical protein IKT40_03290 [Bacilli bacterium]|nr:hypothetical protein [Bacilli bacterium]